MSGHAQLVAAMVEVLGRYSNLRDQGERIQDLLEMIPESPKQAEVRTRRQVQRRLRTDQVDDLVSRYQNGTKVGELATHSGSTATPFRRSWTVKGLPVGPRVSRKSLSRRSSPLTGQAPPWLFWRLSCPSIMGQWP
jgi:hypothetical protein